MSWFGDFGALCAACVPLPSCNLLSNHTLRDSILDHCLLIPRQGHPAVRDLGTILISLLGIMTVAHQILYKSHRMFAAVGRTELSIMFFIYVCVLFLQVFTIGGHFPKNKTFLIWVSAFHLGAMVCFFWDLVLNAFILFQFVEDGTRQTMLFISGTNTAWMIIITFLSLDLAWDITSFHNGHSAGLFFFTLVFPAVAVLIYLILACILVFRKLDEYGSLIFATFALVSFSLSQLILFGLSSKIATATQGRINGSMFATMFDLLSAALLYKFWNSITDDLTT
ncbi:hypothetical protein BGZ83_007519 [Gryganskiella cystojenkinii]|nr:hypothetical protein BGZ83_007519 [Gryganskiella cystojenkinii]